MQVNIVNAGSIDLDRHLVLLRKSFGQSAWAAQIGATLTREFYLWKYFSTAGQAVIASVLADREVVSGVAALPTLFQTPGGVKKGWQIADIATVPSARKRGFYRACLKALIERLGDDMLVCFPNDNSRRGIEEQGFGFATELLTYVRPLNPFATAPRVIADSPAFREPDSAERGAGYSFFRTPDDLEWRYRRNPALRYDVVAVDEGHCVFRPFRLFGSTVSIVMEVVAADERAFCDLVRDAERAAAGCRLRANFIMTSSPLPAGLRARYLTLPQMLLPKRQALFVRMPGAMTPSPAWSVQIGDWDGL